MKTISDLTISNRQLFKAAGTIHILTTRGDCDFLAKMLRERDIYSYERTESEAGGIFMLSVRDSVRSVEVLQWYVKGLS